MTALHPAAPPEAPAASPSPSVVRILHLTDLHYGRGFNEALWDNVKALAPPLTPHLVIVTGDLVNSPFVWCFRAARHRLQALRDALAAAGQTPPLFVIPGNHDTRLFGILPIIWIIPWIIVPLFVIAIAAMAEAVAEDGSNVPVEAQLSLPLWHPEQPDAIFGILSLAAEQGSSRLVDISADAVTTAFRQAASRACFVAVNDLF